MRTLYIAAVVSSFFFLFFLSPILSRRRLDVFHTSTHDVAQCIHRTQKIAKNSISAHHSAICRAISSQLRHVSTIGKKLLNSKYLLHMSSQYGELQPTNGWERFVSLGHPTKFQQVSRLGVITAPTSLIGGQPNFTRCLAVSWAGILYIHFGGSCPLTEFCQVQNSLCVSKSCVLLYIGSVTARHALQQWASAKLCGAVQGMELQNFRRGCLYIRLGGHHVGHRPTF